MALERRSFTGAIDAVKAKVRQRIFDPANDAMAAIRDGVDLGGKEGGGSKIEKVRVFAVVSHLLCFCWLSSLDFY